MASGDINVLQKYRYHLWTQEKESLELVRQLHRMELDLRVFEQSKGSHHSVFLRIS